MSTLLLSFMMLLSNQALAEAEAEAEAEESDNVTVYALSLVYGERTSTPVATTGHNTDVFQQDDWNCIALLNTGAPVNMASLICTNGPSAVGVDVQCDDESRRISTMSLINNHTTIATVGLVCSNAQPSHSQNMRGVHPD